MRNQDEWYSVMVRTFTALTNDVLESSSTSCVSRPTEVSYFLTPTYTAESANLLLRTLPAWGKLFDELLASDNEPVNRQRLWMSLFGDSSVPAALMRHFVAVDQIVGIGLCLSVSDVFDHKQVAHIRQIAYLFYKYELPYDRTTEQAVLDQFVKTEQELLPYNQTFHEITEELASTPNIFRVVNPKSVAVIIRRASDLLSRLFSSTDLADIHPRHGPGAVSTREKLWGKYQWSNVPDRVTDLYPFDAFFCASLGHVCDTWREFRTIANNEIPAKVILVPKDSRGPRLISCEPLSLMWVQQGIKDVLVRQIERHPLTRGRVNFTNQEFNRRAALTGSRDGRYATLDLKEASDRVTTGLVRLLFPPHITRYLMGVRSLGTRLPNGQYLEFQKYAPMGSALCFPVMATIIWALLDAAFYRDPDTRECIRVYGDDIIVPQHSAEYAMSILELFGLVINRSKSCTKGLFRESCGMDAYKGHPVTPVRLKTVWQVAPSPRVYTSYVDFASAMYARRYYRVYDYIVSRLFQVYPEIPEVSMGLNVPSLPEVPQEHMPKRWRINKPLQRKEFLVLTVSTAPLIRKTRGWDMLLRYFSETAFPVQFQADPNSRRFSGLDSSDSENRRPFSASVYTRRDTSKLVLRWRPNNGGG